MKIRIAFGISSVFKGFLVRNSLSVLLQVACWCETNDKEKTAAIAEAEARITDLTSTIEEKTATSSRLNTEIKSP